MKYTLVERKDPSGRKEGKKIFAVPQSEGKVGLLDLAESLNRKGCRYDTGTIIGVIDLLTKALQENLSKGIDVDLGDLGKFSVAFECEGLDVNANIPFDPNRQIKVVKTRWTSSEKLTHLKEEGIMWRKSISRRQEREAKRIFKQKSKL